MTKFTATDSLGNTYFIAVRDNGTVVGWNHNRTPLCLSNFGWTPGGYGDTREAIREAAKQGAAALNRISHYRWTETK